MDKRSEQSKDHKSCDDTDIGVHKYGPGNVREQLNGLWGVVSKEVVGLPISRMVTNCYCKKEEGEKKEGASLLDKVFESGPPIVNTSKPHRVF